MRKVIWSAIPVTNYWVEGCLGSAAVSLALPPLFRDGEVWNDINPELINFWEQLRRNPRVLNHYSQFVLSSRQLWKQYNEENPLNVSPLERAWRFWYIHCFSFSGLSTDFTGFPYNRASANKAFNFENKVKAIDVVHERIKLVHFENQDVLKLMKRIPDNAVAYLDPPYFVGGYAYSNFYGNKESPKFKYKIFRDLLEQANYRWIVSIDNKKYFEELKVRTWFVKLRRKTKVNARVTKGRTIQDEYLIMNYNPNAEDLLAGDFIRYEQEELEKWLDE